MPHGVITVSLIFLFYVLNRNTIELMQKHVSFNDFKCFFSQIKRWGLPIIK